MSSLSSSSSSKFLLQRAKLLFFHTNPSDQSIRNSFLSASFVSRLHMERHPHDMEEKIDPSRECCDKGACDFSPQKQQRLIDTLMPHILNLYSSSATARDFQIYSADASFEDPMMHAHGLKQIKSAFYSIPKVFSESKIVEYSVKENLISPGKYEILIDSKQHYKFLGRPIALISLIRLYVEDGKVVRHEDLWDKKPLKNRDTVRVPMVGRVLETMRRGSMLATHAMMGFGKDPLSGTDQKDISK